MSRDTTKDEKLRRLPRRRAWEPGPLFSKWDAGAAYGGMR
jgi:hypothetical protein